MKIDFVDSTSSVKENFLQSLALLYLPCESFSANDMGENLLIVRAQEENGKYTARVNLKIKERQAFSEKVCKADNNTRLAIKNLIGRAFLEAAYEVFGYRSPYGLFTGIRPAKIASDYLRNNSLKKTLDILEKEYLFLPEKAELCVMTAQNEMNLTQQLEDKSCSLYISIPFCPSKCKYCSFVSSTTPRLLSLIPEYLDKLIKELYDISCTIKSLGLRLKTVYVGGGTPGILTKEQIELITNSVGKLFNITEDIEFTFEAGRPDCITYEKLCAIKDGGVSRISINTQTANNDILKSVGRKHTFEDYVECMNMARKAGIKCINTDLISGLPGESTHSFCESLDRVCEIAPENITVHSFTLKKSSEYKITSTACIDANSKNAGEMVLYAQKKLISEGFKPYYMYRQKNTVGNLDNTGYAKNGYECLYNVYMMGEYHTVFAAGAGAVSKYVSKDRSRIERAFSPKYPYEYLDEKKYSGFDRNFAFNFYNKIY